MTKALPHNYIARLLLVLFLTGQALVYTHRHETVICCGRSAEHALKAGYHEKKPELINCLLCDGIFHKKLRVAQTVLILAGYQEVHFLLTDIGHHLYALVHFLWPRGPPTPLSLKLNVSNKNFNTFHYEKNNHLLWLVAHKLHLFNGL